MEGIEELKDREKGCEILSFGHDIAIANPISQLLRSPTSGLHRPCLSTAKHGLGKYL